jgi:hypothetical protein
MTLDRSDIIGLTKELQEATMVNHALWQKLEALHSDMIDHVRERTAETLSCVSCDIDSPTSLAAALSEGWTRLQADDGLGHNFLGVCKSCSDEEKAPEKPQDASKATPKPTVKAPKNGPKRSTLFPPDNEQ